MYNALIREQGSRGFAAEGIFDGARFFVTDVLFVHDKWIDQIDFECRESTWLKYGNGIDGMNSHMLKMHSVTKSALGVLFNSNISALMVYDENGRVAIGDSYPRNVSVGGESNAILYDEEFRKLGYLRKPNNLDLSYKCFQCLSLSSGNLGIEGLFF